MSSIAEPDRTEVATALADANDAALRRRIEAEVREQDEPKIEALSVLSLRPGDTLIVRVPHITADEAERIKHLLRSQLTVDVPILVAGPEVEFSIARPAGPA